MLLEVQVLYELLYKYHCQVKAAKLVVRLHDRNIYVGDEVEFFEWGGAYGGGRTARCKVVGIDTQSNEPWFGIGYCMLSLVLL